MIAVDKASRIRAHGLDLLTDVTMICFCEEKDAKSGVKVIDVMMTYGAIQWLF